MTPAQKQALLACLDALLNCAEEGYYLASAHGEQSRITAYGKQLTETKDAIDRLRNLLT